MAVAVHLWNIPAHREAWKRVGKEEGGYGQLYQHFAHFLETDAIYLLNDAMEILPKGAHPLPPSPRSPDQIKLSH